MTLFSRQGYPARPSPRSRSEAGVSVETAQKHGPKAALLRHAVEFASFGVEGEPTSSPPTRQGAPGTRARRVRAVIGAQMLGINAPSAGVWMTVVGAAHGDEELGQFQAEMLASIRGRSRGPPLVDQRGWLRGDVRSTLVEAVCILTSVETYVRFVQLDGKSVDSYKAFVARALRDTVLAR